MAIFRQGVKIGPFDIRLGIPRDTSLDNVEGDVRLKQHANTENSIGRFRAMMGRAEGYARQARFKVKIFPPRNLKKMSQQMTSQTNTPPSMRKGGAEAAHPSAVTMQQLWTQMGEQLEMHCDSVSMPAHDLQTETITTFGPPRDVVTGHGFTGTIAATFYADKYLRERHFIEMWQKMAVNMVNHKAGYYDDYASGKIQIFQLGSLDGKATTTGDDYEDQVTTPPPIDAPTYGIEATEVYPEKLSAISYDYARKNTVVKVTVGFQFKEWHNLATDSINGMEYGSSKQTLHDVKGIDGGLLGNLPPELRRIGRNVINQAQTQLPIGRITRGKIFPPFN